MLSNTEFVSSPAAESSKTKKTRKPRAADAPVATDAEAVKPKKKVVKKVEAEAEAVAAAGEPAPEPEPEADKPKKTKKKAVDPVPAAETEETSTPSSENVDEALAAAVKKTVTPAELKARLHEKEVSFKEKALQYRAIKDSVTAQEFSRLAREMSSISKDLDRILKIKPVRKPVDPSKNGFLRPMRITPELAAFVGIEPTARRSRVEITRHLCDYIKEHQLRQEEDQRIVLLDAALEKLLRYDPKTFPNPFFYYHLQKYIQIHFIKDSKDDDVEVDDATLNRVTATLLMASA